MELPSKLQTEIVEYLYSDLQNLPKPMKLKNDSLKNDIIAASMAKGVQLGMERAIMILNNWNKENKGKVVAKPQSSEVQQKVEKEYKQLSKTKASICPDCEGTGFKEDFDSSNGFGCDTCKGTGQL